MARSRDGFTSRKMTICLDCLDRGALDMVGRARRYGGWGQSTAGEERGQGSSYGCETCQGNGYVRLTDKARKDPYDNAKGFSA